MINPSSSPSIQYRIRTPYAKEVPQPDRICQAKHDVTPKHDDATKYGNVWNESKHDAVPSKFPCPCSSKSTPGPN